jgi:rhodanese-related sulfurtransferase
VTSEVNHININEYQDQFADAEAFTLIDVREIDEFEQGRIPNAVNIPLNDLPDRLAEISQDKPVVLVCARGSRSAMAANFMAGQGYTQLYNLVDGTLGWMMRGLPLETD